jgi:hypothetical protein
LKSVATEIANDRTHLAGVEPVPVLVDFQFLIVRARCPLR